MDDEARLVSLVEQLNAMLGEVTPYKLAVVPPADVESVDKNARYMSQRVYGQLVANVKQDGNLSSLPFCWRAADGRFVSLSGNHRVAAARDAGISRVLILYTDAALSKPERVAVQLSHNALVGQDNPATLGELWQQIDDLNLKVYSGLDEEFVKSVPPMAVTQLGSARLRMEELSVFFIEPEIARIQDVLQRLGSTNRTRLAARYADWDRFFESLLEFKEASDILNTATAIMAMIEIVESWLSEHNENERHAS